MPRKLTAEERTLAWAEFMRDLSATRTVVGAINKFELKALMDSHDDVVAAAVGVAPLLQLNPPDATHFRGRTDAERKIRVDENAVKLQQAIQRHQERISKIRDPLPIVPPLPSSSLPGGGS